MKARAVRVLALVAVILPAACDEPKSVITHVDRRGTFSRDDLWGMQDQRGIPVELHGSPFSHVSDRELAEALRPPGGAAQGITYYARPPGGWMQGSPARLVLHFNPQGGPNSVADCKRTGEARTNAPKPDGFSVTATFCDGADWEAQGYMEALDVDDGDLDQFADLMGQLMLAMLREEKDR